MANIMLGRYKDFIIRNISDLSDQKLLLAVSGGVDSMVMLDLSIKANLSFAVAHVNHGMRDSESDADEILVADICRKNDLTFHSYRFSEQDKSSSNFQEKARIVRYRWWNSLCEAKGYSHVLTGHHSSDIVETFLMNLRRGSGIKGLSSIPVSSHNILRPMSNMTKNEIVEYAKFNSIQFRDDSSNQENKYKRNEIRNNWIPYLRSVEPNIEKAIFKSVSNLSKEQGLLNALVKDTIEKYSSSEALDYQSIKLNQLLNDFKLDTIQLLYQYLSAYGFTEDNCTKCISAEVGSEFYSETHELLKDRETLILRKKIEFVPLSFVVQEYGSFTLNNKMELIVSSETIKEGLAISGIKFPFIVRHKRAGDKFKPLGMKGATQKLKDFLTNAKLDKWSKQNTFVIEEDSIIKAILPLRVANGHNDISKDDTVHIAIRYC